MADDEVIEYRLRPLYRVLTLFGAWDRVRLHPNALEAWSPRGTKRVAFAPDMQIHLHMPLLPHHTRPGLMRMLRVSDGTTTIQAGMTLDGFYALAARLLAVEAEYVTPGALARYARGERVSFGPIAVQGDTITLKNETMKRAELTGPLIVHGEIKFHASDRMWPVLSLPETKIPNFVTLTKVLDAQRAALEKPTSIALRPGFARQRYAEAAGPAGAMMIGVLVLLWRCLAGVFGRHDSTAETLGFVAMILTFASFACWPLIQAALNVRKMRQLARHGRLARVRVVDVQSDVRQMGVVKWKIRYRTPRGEQAQQTFVSRAGGPYVLNRDEEELLALTSIDERESLVLRTDAYPLLAPPTADELAKLRG